VSGLAGRWHWGWVALAVAGAVGVAGGTWYYQAKGAGASAAKAGASGDGTSVSAADEPTPVETVRLSPGGIVRTSSQVGSVLAYEDADLYAKVSGYLKALHVDYGSRVKRGQLLAEIDDPEVVKEEARAAAALVQARAAIKQAEARIETAEADKKAADAMVGQAKAEILRTTSKRKYREKVLARYRDLVARNAETQQVVDEQEENLEAARADEYAAKAAEVTAVAQAAAAQAKVNQARADLAEAQANVQVDEANLGKAKVLVDYTRITSPYDGVITKRNFFRGAFIRSAADGQTLPLLSVARTDVVRVATVVPDRDVPLADVGDPAEVTFDAFPNEVFKGKVSRFADTEDMTSRTMYTEIDLPNPTDRLRPGMYGIAKITLGTDPKTATLPASCIVGETKGDKADVYVVKNGKVKKASIRVGADDGIRIEVLEGLDPKDEVILGTNTVTEGMSVRPATAPAGGAGPKTGASDAAG